MFDPRTKLSEQVVEEVQRYFGELVYDVIIPRTVRLSEAPGYGQPITVYDPKSKGAECYRELAREVALRPPPDRADAGLRRPPHRGGAGGHDDAVARPPMDEAELDGGPDGACGRSRRLRRRHGGRHDRGGAGRARSRGGPGRDHRGRRRRDRGRRGRRGPGAVRRRCRASRPRRPRSSAARRPSLRDRGRPRSPRRSARRGPRPSRDEEDVWEEVDEAPAASPRVSPPRSPAPPGHLPERRVVVIDEDAADYRRPPSRQAHRRLRARDDAETASGRGRHRRHARGRGWGAQATMATVPQGRRVMSKRGGLGRGLSALIPGAPEAGERRLRAARGAGERGRPEPEAATYALGRGRDRLPRRLDPRGRDPAAHRGAQGG